MILLIMLGLYIMPAIIACIRKKRNAGAIAVLNVFAGWTFVGWIAALVWSVCEDNERRLL